MAVEEQTVVQHAERIACRVVDERALVIVIDQKKLHVLNPVGSRVWELADGRSVGAIADTVALEFEVERSQALQDVKHFVHELEQLGALILQGAVHGNSSVS